MSDTLSATEARIHFGELLRKVVETGRHVIVARAGKPQVVVMSIEEFERLRGSKESQRQVDALTRAQRLGATIRARRSGEPLTPPEELIRKARGDRDAELADLL